MKFIGYLLITPLLLSSVMAEDFMRLQPDLPASYKPANSGAEAGIWLEMSKAEEAIKHSPSRIKDPELDGYLQGLLCKLAQDYCDDIRVYVIRQPHFNAFMAPNGMMMLWTGLLIRAKNEAQLATVLGHEIGHYLRKHSIKNFNDVKTKSSLFSFFTVGIAGAVGTGNMNANTGQLVIDLSQVAVMASVFAYGRSHEKEADKYGVQLLSDANLRTSESAKIWESLIAETNAANYKKPRPPIFFSTHPAPKDRVSKLKAYSRILSSRKQKEESIGLDVYQQHMRPHIKMMLADELKLHQFGQSEYLFQSLLNDGIAPGIVNYYLGELHRIRKEEGDYAIAKQYYGEAQKHADHDPELYRSLGIIYLKEKNFGLANAQFEEYLAQMPEANDKEMIQFYMKMGNRK